MSKKLKTAILTLAVATGAAGLVALTAHGIEGAKSNSSETSTVNVATSDSSSKLVDENVYVFARANGQTRKIISSDWTRNLDVDEYTNFRSDDKKLPIELAVSYFLDGKEISADDLAGKSGHVTVRYNFTNTETVAGYYVPYAVVSGAMLDNERFKNVEVVNGKLMNDGGRTIVMGVMLPGMQENLGVSKSEIEIPTYLEFSADVAEFKLGMTLSVATNEFFSELDFENLNSLDQLSAQLDKLNSAMAALVSGSADLASGVELLYEKASALPDGVATIASGATRLADGATKLASGATTLRDGVESLYNAINTQLVSKNSSLKSGASSAFSSLIKNTHDILKLKITIATNATTAEALIPEDFTAANYDEKLTALADNPALAAYKTEILNAKGLLDAYRDQFMAGLTAYTNGVAYINESQIKGNLLAKIEAEDGLTAGAEALASGANDLADGLSTLNNAAPSLIAGIEQLRDGSAKLASGVKQFNDEGIQKLVNVYNNDISSLISRIKTIANVAKNNAKDTRYIYRTDEI